MLLCMDGLSLTPPQSKAYFQSTGSTLRLSAVLHQMTAPLALPVPHVACFPSPSLSGHSSGTLTTALTPSWHTHTVREEDEECPHQHSPLTAEESEVFPCLLPLPSRLELQHS